MLGALVSAHSYRRNSRYPGRVRGSYPEGRGRAGTSGSTARLSSVEGMSGRGIPTTCNRSPRCASPYRTRSDTRAGRWSPIRTSSPSATWASCSRASCRARRSGAGRGPDTTRSPIRSRPRSCCSTAQSCRTGASRRTVRRAVGTSDRLSRLDQPRSARSSNDRAARARVERFRPSDAPTKLLHNTKRRTQPWKTGLPIDFTFRERKGLLNLALPIVRMIAPRYTRHPDRNQEAYFYALLAEASTADQSRRSRSKRRCGSGHVRPRFAGAYRALSRPFVAGGAGCSKSRLTRSATNCGIVGRLAGLGLARRCRSKPCSSRASQKKRRSRG